MLVTFLIYLRGNIFSVWMTGEYSLANWHIKAHPYFASIFVIPISSVLTVKNTYSDRIFLVKFMVTVINVLRSALGTLLCVSHFIGIKVHMESGSPEHLACPRRGRCVTKSARREREVTKSWMWAEWAAQQVCILKYHLLEGSLSYYSAVISLSNLTKPENWSCVQSPHGVDPLLSLPLPIVTTAFLPAPHSSEATEPEECCIRLSFLKFPQLAHQRE